MTSTTTRNETQIAADPAVPTIVITREFEAPPQRVFRAYVEPDLVAQWLGPRGYEMRVETFDCRDGGSYRYTHVDGENEYRFRGCFHVVRPNELIIQTFEFEGAPDGVALERMTFEDLGNGRTRLVGTSLVDSFADRDAFVASGMESGIRDAYEQLDELLAR